jgi:aldose 1-epimerase
MKGHELEPTCSRYLPVTDDLPLTGEVRVVAGASMDFTTSKPIGRDLAKMKGGYDHCFVRAKTGRALERISSACDPKTGRSLDISTRMTAIQLSTGNFFGGVQDSGGKPYPRRSAFCLETSC